MNNIYDNSKNRGPIAWMANNPVAANLLMAVLLIGGLLWGGRIKQEVFPEFDLDIVTVTVPYPGASPEEVENGIILAIEEAVLGLDGVDKVTSSAREGSGVVTLELVDGADIQKLVREVQQEVDAISSFPESSEDPQVKLATRRRGVMTVLVHGDADERVLRETAEKLRDRFLQDTEITQAELTGTRDYEISIEVPQENLLAYRLTLGEIAGIVANAAVEIPGGSIKTDSGEILVRMTERKNSGDEFGRIPVLTFDDGTELLLEDIARIVDGFEESDYGAMYNNQPAIGIEVYRVGSQTPVSVSAAVKKQIENFRTIIPAGLNVSILNDASDMYLQRRDLLLNNGYIGLLLVFITLGLFLESRLAFWVSMGIPISFLGSMLFLPLLGVTVNMISMFAFIVALGIVVDDAIVVGENIHKFREQGDPPLKASVKGAREVVMPVTFSILTNVATFMPMYFVPGMMGKVFVAVPAVVITVILISLVESVFVLPAHLGHQKHNSHKHRMISGFFQSLQQGFSRKFMGLVAHVYGPVLRRVLNYRYLAVATGILVLMITLAWVQSGRMGMTLFPRTESDFAKVTAVLPYGSDVKKTKIIAGRLVAAAERVALKNGGDNLVEGIFTEIGGTYNGTSGSHIVKIRAFLTNPEIRPMGTQAFSKAWRKQVGNLAGLETIMFQSDAGGPGSGAALTIQLNHEDVATLEQAGQELAAALGAYSQVKDIDDGFSPGKRQLDFRVLPEGESLGLSAKSVADQVRNSYYGAEAIRQQQGRNEVKVMVRLPREERVSEYHVEEMILQTPAGGEVPLRDIVSIEKGRAYTSIAREDGRRVISVTANVDPASDTEKILSQVKAEVLPALADGYPGLRYGFKGKQADMAESIKSLAVGLAMAMLVVYALLAIPFKSYIQPLIVMASIPFGMVGAVIGHLLMGYSLSVVSMFGVVALSGVVINDSLVLIDFANRERRDGKRAIEAIVSAGVRRFRPILLTTLTTFGGLTPMILETSRQARFMIPMALSLGFGILFATVITLLLVPAFYLILEDVKSIGRSFRISVASQPSKVRRQTEAL